MKASRILKTTVVCMIIFFSCLLLQLSCSALEKGIYRSVMQLNEEVKIGWHKTYEAYGRTITVDVDVELPDIDIFPVLRVKKAAAVSEDLLQGYTVYGNRENYLGISMIPADYKAANIDDAWFKQTYALHSGEIDWSKRLAEDNPLTAQEALDIFRQKLVLFFGEDRFSDLLLRELIVRGGLYEYDRKTKTFGNPLDTLGMYDFTFAQSLHGIPILVDGNWLFSPQIPGEPMPPATQVSADVSSADFFSFMAQLVDEVDVSQTDVPLLTFENVKAEYEKLITAGLLREVFDIELGYMLSTDPSDKDVFWATPVWVLSGVMYDSSKQEPAPTTDEIKDTRPMRMVIMDAQHANLIGRNDTRITRRQVPTVITWDQVR